MNVFEAVKDHITARQVAERYGVYVSRRGMAVCPFHDDKTPSMKVDWRFHCFGCQADGDAVDFVSRLYDIPCRDAARKIADDFEIVYDSKKKSAVNKNSRKTDQAQNIADDETNLCRVLTQYLHLLQKWREQYPPKRHDVSWHPLFAEAMQNTDYIEYLLDILIYGTEQEKQALVTEKQGEVMKLDERIRTYEAAIDCGRGAEQSGHDRKRRRAEYDQKLSDGHTDRSDAL